MSLKERVRIIAQENDTYFTGYAHLDSEVLLNGHYHYNVQLKHNTSTIPLVKVYSADTKLSYPVNLVEVTLKKYNGQFMIVSQDSGISSAFPSFEVGTLNAPAANGPTATAIADEMLKVAEERERVALIALENARSKLQFEIEQILDPAGPIRSDITDSINDLRDELNQAYANLEVSVEDLADPAGDVRQAITNQIRLTREAIEAPNGVIGTRIYAVEDSINTANTRLNEIDGAIAYINDPAGTIRQEIINKIADVKNQIEAQGSVLDQRFDNEVNNINGSINTINADINNLDTAIQTVNTSINDIYTTDIPNILAEVDTKDTQLRNTINTVDIQPIKDKADQTFNTIYDATSGIQVKLDRAISDLNNNISNTSNVVGRVDVINNDLNSANGIKSKITTLETTKVDNATLAAESLRITQLDSRVGNDSSNLVANPSGDYGIRGWSDTVINMSADVNSPTPNMFKAVHRDNTYGMGLNPIPITVGEKFYISAWCRSDVDHGVAISLGFFIRGRDNSTIIGWFKADGATRQTSDNTGTWKKIEGVYTVTDNGFAYPWVQLDYFGDDKAWYFSRLEVRSLNQNKFSDAKISNLEQTVTTTNSAYATRLNTIETAINSGPDNLANLRSGISELYESKADLDTLTSEVSRVTSMVANINYSTQENKWRFVKYPFTNNIPYLNELINLKAIDSYFVNDGTDLIKNIGDMYTGHLQTNVYVVNSVSIPNFSFIHDDGCRLFINGNEVYSNGVVSNPSGLFLTLNKGWNTIDFIWTEGGGGDGIYAISPTFGSQVQILAFNGGEVLSRVVTEASLRASADGVIQQDLYEYKLSANSTMGDLDARTTNLEENTVDVNTFTSATTRISNIENSVNTGTNSLTNLRSSISSLESSKADGSALIASNQRINNLESSVNTGSNSLSNLRSSISTLESTKADGSALVASNQRILNLESSVNSGSDSLSNLRSSINNVQSTKADASDLSALTTTVNNLSSEVTDGLTDVNSYISDLYSSKASLSDLTAATTRVSTLEATVRNKDNLVINSNNEQSEVFITAAVPSQISRVLANSTGVPTGALTNYVIRTNARDAVVNKGAWIDVMPGDTFYVSAYVANTPNTTFTVNLMFHSVDKSETVHNFNTVVSRAPNHAVGTWTKLEGTYTIPEGAVKTQLFLQQDRDIYNTDASDSWYVTGLELRNTNSQKDARSRITNLETVVTSPTTGVATRLSSLETALQTTDGNTNYARINTIQSVAVDAQGKANATYGVDLDVNGRASGWKNVNNGSSSIFSITADKFYIYNPSVGDQPVFAMGTVNGINKLGIRADMIVDGSITTRNMVAGTIDANVLTARSISADKIASKSITASEIQSGVITADLIAAKAITADKLAIGGGKNLLDNTEFAGGMKNGWFGQAITSSNSAVPVDTFNTVRSNEDFAIYCEGGVGLYVQSSRNDLNRIEIVSERIPVTEGMNYIASAYISAHRCSYSVTIAWFDINDNYLTESGSTQTIGQGESNTYLGIPRAYVFKTAPVNAKYARLYYRGFIYGGSDPYIFISKPMLEQASLGQSLPNMYTPSGSTLIDAGKIVTGQISANVVDAEMIRSKVISATKINAQDIIAAGSITATQVNTTNVRLSMFNGDGKLIETDIRPGEIRTNLIATDAIQARHIQAGVIGADKLAVGNGTNMVFNSMFRYQEAGWYIGGSGSYSITTRSDFTIPGVPALELRPSNGLTNTSGKYADTRHIDITPGDFYMISAYVSSHRITAQMTVIFLDASYNYVAVYAQRGPAPDSGGNTPNSQTRIFVQGQAPNSAIKMLVRLESANYGDTGATLQDAYMWWSRIMVERSKAGATQPSVYTESGSTLIDGSTIQTGFISADRIQAGSIKASKIDTTDLKLSMFNPTTGEIMATHIKPGEINTMLVNTYALDAVNIKAGAITVDKLSVGKGINLISNSDFSSGFVGWEWRNINGTNAASTLLSGVPSGMLADITTTQSDPQYNFGATTLRIKMQQITDDAAVWVDTPKINLVAGTWYFFQGMVASHRVTTRIEIIFYNGSNNVVSTTVVNNNVYGNVNSGGNSRTTWINWSTKVQAPAGTSYVKIRTVNNQVFDLNTKDAYIWLTQYMVEEASATTTQPSPYSQGGSTLIDGSVIKTGSISANHITAGTITANELAANAGITATQLAIVSSTIDGPKIQGTYIDKKGIFSTGSITSGYGFYLLKPGSDTTSPVTGIKDERLVFGVDGAGTAIINGDVRANNFYGFNSILEGVSEAERFKVRFVQTSPLTLVEKQSKYSSMAGSGNIAMFAQANAGTQMNTGAQLYSTTLSIPNSKYKNIFVNGVFTFPLQSGQGSGVGAYTLRMVWTASNGYSSTFYHTFNAGVNLVQYLSIPFAFTVDANTPRLTSDSKERSLTCQIYLDSVQFNNSWVYMQNGSASAAYSFLQVDDSQA